MSKKQQRVILSLAILATVFLTAGLMILFRPIDDKLSVAFLSVGQGDSILIRTPDDRTVLIDGGPDQTVLTRLGQLLPWWERRLDAVILTHDHDDHLQGLLAVMDKYQIGRFIIDDQAEPLPESLSKALKQRQTALFRLNAGGELSLGKNLKMMALWPKAGETMADINDRSLVLELIYGQTKFLLAGDASVKVEAELIKDNVLGQVDVFKASHHGSDTAGSQAFLDYIHPRWTVVEVGLDNRLGHPNRRILQRLARVGSAVLRTDLDGTVIFYSDGKQLSYETVK